MTNACVYLFLVGKKAPPKTLSKDHYKMYKHIFDGAERKREKNFAKADTVVHCVLFAIKCFRRGVVNN
jgi:hypothetical protein